MEEGSKHTIKRDWNLRIAKVILINIKTERVVKSLVWMSLIWNHNLGRIQ